VRLPFTFNPAPDPLIWFMFHPLRAYDNYLNANMDMGMLQAAGINCHIKDEYTITIDPLLSPALGGMKLMVEETDLEEARAMLQDRDAGTSEIAE
jgi:hypothetical protein